MSQFRLFFKNLINSSNNLDWMRKLNLMVLLVGLFLLTSCNLEQISVSNEEVLMSIDNSSSLGSEVDTEIEGLESSDIEINNIEGNNSEVIEKMTDNPIVKIETSIGTIKIELFESRMPITANNFKKLVNEGFYDGTRFHRVIANFMVQGGDPLSKEVDKKQMWGTGGPGYEIKDEFVEGLSNNKGTIAMANHGPNTGGSQFFINLVDNTYLDWDKQPLASKHPVFGKVVEGMSIIEEIGKVHTDLGDKPTEDIILIKLTIE